MAYYQPNYYFPTGYQPAQPQIPQAPQQQAAGGITWVQGEAAAKAYPVGNGQSVLLMDSENALMYIKSTDQSGMPLPLRVFEYKERTAQQAAETINAKEPPIDYVPRAEFEKFKEEIKKSLRSKKAPEKEGEG